MWREELGLVEMLLTYIGDFVQFESYSGWRPVLIDILTSHEEVRRRRLAEAIEYSSGERIKDDIVEDFFDETRQSCNQNEDHRPTGESNAYSQSLIEYSYGVNREDDNYFIESDGMASRISECVDDNMKVENDVMVEEETVGQLRESTVSEESIVCLEMEKGDAAESGNDSTRGVPEISIVNALSEGNGMETQHGGTPGNFSCLVCGKSFVTKQSLTRHMRYHNQKKSYKCDKCDRAFFSNVELKRHLQTHSGERPFSCTLCGKALSQKSTLMKHMRTHSGERPFQCHLCGKTFAQDSNLKVHIRGVHFDERPFSCQLCGKAFRVKSGVKRHLESCHDSSVTVSSFSCE